MVMVLWSMVVWSMVLWSVVLWSYANDSVRLVRNGVFLMIYVPAGQEIESEAGRWNNPW